MKEMRHVYQNLVGKVRSHFTDLGIYIIHMRGIIKIDRIKISAEDVK
jgi:hypothetical protein